MGTCGLRRLRGLKPRRACVCKAGDAGEEATPMVDVQKLPDEQKANTIDFLTPGPIRSLRKNRLASRVFPSWS